MDSTAPPRRTVMASIEVPATTVHDDGTTTVGTARIVHTPEAAPGLPLTIEIPCSPRCGCRPCC